MAMGPVIEAFRADRMPDDVARALVGVLVFEEDGLRLDGIRAIAGELGLLQAVKIGKRPGHHVSILELRRVRQWLKQPPPHDLESLFCRRWAPRRLYAADDIAQPVQCLASPRTTYLHII